MKISEKEISQKNKIQHLKKGELKKAKEITFAKGYFIFNDGRCYSEKTNRFLTKRRTKGKSPGKYYYCYDLNPYGNCLVSRLVMFFYGSEKYDSIKEMPKIIHIDANPENTNIDNLKFATQSEINKINNISPPRSCYENRGTIKIESKKLIENMLEQKLTYGKISNILETSEMAVYRFVKKHIKN
jgi:hypothetical protein